MKKVFFGLFAIFLLSISSSCVQEEISPEEELINIIKLEEADMQSSKLGSISGKTGSGAQ